MSTPTIPDSEASERDAVAEMRAGLLADGWTPGRLAAKLAAFSEIAKQYGGKYIAYRLTWDGDRLIEPVVVHVTSHQDDVYRWFAALPLEEQRVTTTRYVRPYGQAMGY